MENNWKRKLYSTCTDVLTKAKQTYCSILHKKICREAVDMLEASKIKYCRLEVWHESRHKCGFFLFFFYSGIMFQLNDSPCILDDCKTAFIKTFKVYLDIKKPWALKQKPPLHFNGMFMPRAKPPFWLCWYAVQVHPPHKQSWGRSLVCYLISADCIYYLSS